MRPRHYPDSPIFAYSIVNAQRFMDNFKRFFQTGALGQIQKAEKKTLGQKSDHKAEIIKTIRPKITEYLTYGLSF